MVIPTLQTVLRRRGLTLFRVALCVLLVGSVGAVTWQVFGPRDQIIMPTAVRRTGVSTSDVDALLLRVETMRARVEELTTDPFTTTLDTTVRIP